MMYHIPAHRRAKFQSQVLQWCHAQHKWGLWVYLIWLLVWRYPHGCDRYNADRFKANLSSNSTLSHIGSAAQNGLNHSATAWRSMLPIYIYIWAWGSMQVSRMKNNLQQHVFLLMLFWWLFHLGSMLGPCWLDFFFRFCFLFVGF